MEGIGSRIKRWRERKNLTQEFLASELNISQSAYSRLEADETNCTYTRIIQIAKILNIRPEELICGEHTTFAIMHNKHASGITFNESGTDYRDEYIQTLKEQLNLLRRVIEEGLNKLNQNTIKKRKK